MTYNLFIIPASDEATSATDWAKCFPNTKALASDIVMQCNRAFSLKFVLMKAACIPTLAIPSHKPTNSGEFSNNIATVSLDVKPTFWK